MEWARRIDQRGFTLLELLVASFTAGIMFVGLSAMYVSTVRALEESASQAALQRVGALAIQAITRQAALADSNPGTPADSGCIPAGTTGSTLAFVVVTDRTTTGTSSTGATTAVRQQTFCYYAGNANNSTRVGALCQRMVDEDGVVRPCRDLLAIAQPDASTTSRTTPIKLIMQTSQGDAYINAANQTVFLGPPAFCPRTTTDGAGAPVSAGTAIANNVHCFAAGLVNGNPQTGDIGFAITDGLSRITFTGSLMLQNHQ